MKARTQAANQLRAVIVTAPEDPRQQLRGMRLAQLIATALRFRPADPETLEAASKLALKALAARYQHLDEEITALDAQIDRLAAGDAHMRGVAPIPASSGKTTRHRLNRGGNREASQALYMLAVRPLSYDPRAQDHAARRTAEGRSKREIIRCIKR